MLKNDKNGFLRNENKSVNNNFDIIFCSNRHTSVVIDYSVTKFISVNK